jgi:hypothetical protein
MPPAASSAAVTALEVEYLRVEDLLRAELLEPAARKSAAAQAG